MGRPTGSAAAFRRFAYLAPGVQSVANDQKLANYRHAAAQLGG